MKRAQSHLIDMFLADVKSGLIIGKENSSGPIALQEMADALQSVLDGADTDEALQIKRVAGKPAEDKNFAVALIMHDHKEDRKPGAYANDWLEKSGYETLSDTRLREIYKQHREKIERLESIKEMIEKTQDSYTHVRK